jgi:hypothetical protein
LSRIERGVALTCPPDAFLFAAGFELGGLTRRTALQ